MTVFPFRMLVVIPVKIIDSIFFRMLAVFHFRILVIILVKVNDGIFFRMTYFLSYVGHYPSKDNWRYFLSYVGLYPSKDNWQYFLSYVGHYPSKGNRQYSSSYVSHYSSQDDRQFFLPVILVSFVPRSVYVHHFCISNCIADIRIGYIHKHSILSISISQNWCTKYLSLFDPSI